MSNYQADGPFDSIESAYDFTTLLANTALEVMVDLGHERARALREGDRRRAQAIDLAIFKLKNLNCNLCKSRRMLNDLHILRRLILNERLTPERVMAAM